MFGPYERGGDEQHPSALYNPHGLAYKSEWISAMFQTLTTENGIGGFRRKTCIKL